VAESDDVLTNALTALSESGFVNYFGMQRFGTGEIGTHDVGREILRGKWQAAIDLLLQPKGNGA
jgi:tRNA pseudouridine13 synthase